MTNEPTVDELLGAAERYRQLGLQVLPLNKKIPSIKNWQNHTPDPATLKERLRAAEVPAIGVRMGPSSGIIDFEYDTPAQLAKLQELFDGAPPDNGPAYTSAVDHDGEHWWFAWDDRLDAIGKHTVEILCGTLPNGKPDKLLVRIGAGNKGAQSVVPPSPKKAWKPGRAYGECELPSIPESVITRLLDLAKVKRDKSGDNGGGNKNKKPRKLKRVPMHTVKPLDVDWLWQDRIELGAVTVLGGMPDVNKSALVVDLATRVSNGESFPDDPRPGASGHVFIFSSEDGKATTIRPRLDAAGWNESKVDVIEEDGDFTFNIMTDIAELERLIDEVEDCKLIIFDPISAYMGKTNTHSESETRDALVNLQRLAERKHVAVVAIRHLTKDEKGDVLSRFMGSIAFIGVARSGLCLTRYQEEHKRALFTVKHNHAPDGVRPLVLQIENAENGRPRIDWLLEEEVTIRAGEALEGAPRIRGPKPEEREKAKQMLLADLQDGPRPVAQLKALATAQHITDSTLYRAAKDLGIVMTPGKGYPPTGSTWQLPTSKADESEPEMNAA